MCHSDPFFCHRVTGWYGFIPAAGIVIIRCAQVPDNEGYAALQALGAPDEERAEATSLRVAASRV